MLFSCQQRKTEVVRIGIADRHFNEGTLCQYQYLVLVYYIPYTMWLISLTFVAFLPWLLHMRCAATAAFSVPYNARRITHSMGCCLPSMSAVRHQDDDGDDSNFLLQEFSIASGEIINPYDVLKLPRKATRDEVRASYIKQSRRYHPDAFRNGKGNNNILPGSCNNLDDVRDQWERIKLSYEILSNPKTRRRYDRHAALSDPNAAIQRVVMDAALNGITNVGKGLFGIGSLAVQAMTKGNDKNAQRVD